MSTCCSKLAENVRMVQQAMLTLFNQIRSQAPEAQPAQRFPELQAKIADTQQAMVNLRSLLLASSEHAIESMFQYNKHKLEATQLKLGCYDTIMLTTHTSLDQDTLLLIETYEQQIEDLYCNKDEASFYISWLLKQEYAKADDHKTRFLLSIAIDICKKKVLLQQVTAQLILEQILKKLEVTGARSENRIKKLKQEFDALRDYDRLKFNYKDNTFSVEFPFPNEDVCLDHSYPLPAAALLEQLFLLSRDHMQITYNQRVMLIDMIGCALARPQVLAQRGAKVVSQSVIAKAVQKGVHAKLYLT